MITDLEYPLRPAFSLLTKILDEHTALLASLPNQSAAPSFGSASANAFGGNPSQAAAGGLPPAQKGKLEGTLANYLTKYQDPKQADTIMKVQKELDETKVVLVGPLCSRAGAHADRRNSTRRLNRFLNEAKSSTISWNVQTPSRRKAKCSTRLPRRFVLFRSFQTTRLIPFPIAKLLLRGDVTRRMVYFRSRWRCDFM